MPAIAFITRIYYGDFIGGAERQIQLLARALREQGWKTIYICERKADKFRFEIIDGMEILALPFVKRRQVWRNYLVLKAAMKECNADLYYNRVRYPYTGLATHIAHRMSKPIVFAAASKADVVRREDLRDQNIQIGKKDRLMHPLTRYIEDWGILKANAIILQTEQQLELLKKNYHRDGIVIPNHIYLPESKNNRTQSNREILWISNIKPFKRPQLFVELAERCQDVNAKFIMIGSCVLDDILCEIKLKEKQLANFTYSGPIEPEEAEKCIASASLIVNTSEFEGFPNVFQQAWAHGVPTLSLGIDPDGVIEREGLGKCAQSLVELEKYLRKFMQDEKLRQEVGQRAINFSHQTYDLRNLLPKYLSLFESLLQK